jgi:hypothetical protein
MRLLFLLGVILAGGSAYAEDPVSTNAAPDASPTFNYSAPAEPQVPALHQAWAAERDPAKRKELAKELVEAVIHEYDKAQIDIVDEVARDGAPKNEIRPPAMVRTVNLTPLTVLTGEHFDWSGYPPSPVFRRMSANRFEAWTAKEGWLFDGDGSRVADVKVPRRDGNGGEWFGAFLPNGTWVTTDLWANDEQLNCYNSGGKWLWELPGSKIVARLPKSKSDPQNDERLVPSVGWSAGRVRTRRGVSGWFVWGLILRAALH